MSLLSGTPKFRVAICGAGIGGLVLAITIGKFASCDVQIDLYEAHDAITTAGAGIVFSRRTMEVVEALGLYEEVSHVSTKSSATSHVPHFRKSDIPEGGFTWFQHLLQKGPPTTMHRQHLVNILKEHLPASCTVHFNKRLTIYDRQPAGSLVLQFADDSTATTDVLIGADGIRSSVRKTLFETTDQVVDPDEVRHYTDASWTGISVYRAVIPVEKLSEIDTDNIALRNFVMFCGKGKQIASYPVSQGTLINIAALVCDDQKAGTPFEGHWVSDVSREEVDEAFQNFEPAARNVLKCCENLSRWALHVVNELPLCTCDRVALIGDACHAMSPHMGAGAGQAMEDAFVLGRLLAHPLTMRDNVHIALKAYQDVRLSVAQSVARDSIRAGRMIRFEEPGYYDGTDHGNEREELDILEELITNHFGNSQGQDGAIAGWQEAERNLKESVRCQEGTSLPLTCQP